MCSGNVWRPGLKFLGQERAHGHFEDGDEKAQQPGLLFSTIVSLRCFSCHKVFAITALCSTRSGLSVTLTPAARVSAQFCEALNSSDHLRSQGARFQRFLNPSSHCPSDLRTNLSFKHLLAERHFQSLLPTRATGRSFCFSVPTLLRMSLSPGPFYALFSVHFSVISQHFCGGSIVERLKNSVGSDVRPI